MRQVVIAKQNAEVWGIKKWIEAIKKYNLNQHELPGAHSNGRARRVFEQLEDGIDSRLFQEGVKKQDLVDERNKIYYLAWKQYNKNN